MNYNDRTNFINNRGGDFEVATGDWKETRWALTLHGLSLDSYNALRLDFEYRVIEMDGDTDFSIFYTKYVPAIYGLGSNPSLVSIARSSWEDTFTGYRVGPLPYWTDLLDWFPLTRELTVQVDDPSHNIDHEYAVARGSINLMFTWLP